MLSVALASLSANRAAADPPSGYHVYQLPNRASEAVGRSIAELRETISSLTAVFLAFCT